MNPNQTKDTILGNLRRNVRETYEKPDLSFAKLEYQDAVAAFIHTATTAAGASVIEMKEGDDINDLIHSAYPNARTIASNVEGVKADRNPDKVEKPQQLDGTDVSVVLGTVACAENACVWIPQTMKERAVCFICEYLVIIVDRKNIVSNMHEAYARIEMPESGFGAFISGPSKTADIEQALVYGAQSFCGVTIILR
ncbi:MAG: LUD domain-containing protein [Muribaculaceae bacterium]|nr:LUD domain-containing protein [Muribaculaceae bacterium]